MSEKQVLDIACANLAYAIKNSRLDKDYSDSWRKMAMTSSAKRALVQEQKKMFAQRNYL